MMQMQIAQELRNEYEAATGVWPAYPRSRIALDRLCEILDRIKAAQDAIKTKAVADEFARLTKTEPNPNPDNLDLDADVPHPVRLPAGESWEPWV